MLVLTDSPKLTDYEIILLILDSNEGEIRLLLISENMNLLALVRSIFMFPGSYVPQINIAHDEYMKKGPMFPRFIRHLKNTLRFKTGVRLQHK